ncbi:RF-1 domain-containing protein [Mycena floridula]|nr:RF-1 domain-containing protein [Mycena floridula]
MLLTRNLFPLLPWTARAASSLPIPPPIPILDSPEATQQARQWISAFRTQAIPKTHVELSFSRSSGPGGQNVNKVNTKATIRCSLDSEWIPAWARHALKKSSFYVASSKTIMFTSSQHRSQAQNIEDCLEKLHALVLSTSSESIRNETPEEKKKHVANLQKAAKARNKEDKIRRSAVKQRRKPGSWD